MPTQEGEPAFEGGHGALVLIRCTQVLAITLIQSIIMLSPFCRPRRRLTLFSALLNSKPHYSRTIRYALH